MGLIRDYELDRWEIAWPTVIILVHTVVLTFTGINQVLIKE